MPEAADYDRTARGIQSAKEPVQIVGMEPVAVAGSAEVTVTYEPDYDLNVEGFRTTDALAPNFSITNMTIGPINVMAGRGPFPLDAFRGASTLKLALAVPVTQKQPLKVTYRNMTTNAVTAFYCGVVGKVKRAV